MVSPKQSTQNQNGVPKCRTVLLSDEPEEKDFFEGAHNRTAKAILSLVSEETGGHTIGIEGNYGSGKTTLINIIHSEMKQNDNYALVSFDAWAHEGDPLRRTFLESIIRHLKRLGWINESKWAERLEEIAQRREVKNTKTIPHLTTVGKALGFSLFLVPLGLAIVNAALREDLTLFEFSRPLSQKFVLGTLLATGPLIVLVMAWIFARLKRQENKPQSEVGRLWAIIFNKAITEERSETTKTINPTSIEFEDTFKELMTEALDVKTRRMLLILDNLDRVEAKDALTIWSTLQTFVGHSHYGHPEWFDRLWIVVLYDPNGLGLLWEKTNSKKRSRSEPEFTSYADSAKQKVETEDSEDYEPTVTTDPNRLEPSQSQETNGEFLLNDVNIASSFIEKSFQIRFQVTPPVLSDWYEYLLSLLKQALPNHDHKEFHDVYRVLDAYLTSLGKTPNIRRFKLFVNQIGALHRQWEDTFPLSHLAYYVLWQEEAQVSVEWFLTHPRKDFESIVGEEVRSTLAALAFNVEPAKAMQFLLAPRLKKILTDGDLGSLAELLSFHSGFFQILERIFTTDRTWLEGRNDLLLNAAYCLSESEILTTHASPESSNVVKQLLDMASRVGAWSAIDAQKARGLAALCYWGDDYQSSEQFLRAVVFGSHAFRNTNRNLDIEAFANALIIIRERLREKDLGHLFETGIVRTIGERLRAEHKNGPITLTSHPLGWEQMCLVRTLVELSYLDESASELCQRLNAEGTMLHHLHEGVRQLNVGNPHGAPTPDITAWCLFAILREYPDVTRNEIFASRVTELESLSRVLKLQAKEGEPKLPQERVMEVTQRFINIVDRFKRLDILFDLLDTQPEAEPFAIKCLTSILRDTSLALRLVSPDIIIERWHLLIQYIEGQLLEPQQLLELISAHRENLSSSQVDSLIQLISSTKLSKSPMNLDRTLEEIKRLRIIDAPSRET